MKKFKILGILIVMAIALCGAFNLSVPKYVFADETPVQESTLENEAGTFEGVGEYGAGATITLKATPNLGYDFYWLSTDGEGNKKVVKDEYEESLTEEGYTFTTTKAVTVSVVTRKAGTFTVDGEYTTSADGKPFFIVGGTATLTAVMEPGFTFVGWTGTKEDGTSIDLSINNKNTYNDPETGKETTICEITVNGNIIITPTWEKAKYDIKLVDTDYFKLSYTNNTQESGFNYYEDNITINISVNRDLSDLYVKNLEPQNIKINGTDLVTIKNNNTMGVEENITNDSNNGFSTVEITLNIKDTVVIDIDYIKMFILTIASGNAEIDINEVAEFIKPVDTVEGTGYHKKLTPNTYLLYENTGLTLSFTDDGKIYEFVSYQKKDMQPVAGSNSVTMSISEPQTLTVNYNIRIYKVSFMQYIQNVGIAQLNESVYTIQAIDVKPGQIVGYAYDETNQKITITVSELDEDLEPVIVDTFEYLPGEVYGYEFARFAVEDGNGNNITSVKYEMSSTDPSNGLVKIIFTYKIYELNVELNDTFFESGVQINVSNNKGLPDNKMIKGAKITVKATTEKYVITGWEFINLGETPVGNASDLLSEGHEFIFNPSSGDNYSIKLIIDYKYTDAKFEVKAKGGAYDGHTEQYFASIKVSHIEKVNVALGADSTATVTLIGTTYSIGNNDGTPIVVEAENTTILEFDSAMELLEGKYKLTYSGSFGISQPKYTVYLYMSDESISDGDRVVLPNMSQGAVVHTTEFVYNGSSFVLPQANTAPTSVSGEAVQDDTNLSIKLNNLLPNAVLLYSAQNTNASIYKITGYSATNDGRVLAIGCFEKDGYVNTLMPVTYYNHISVECAKLEKTISVKINDTHAYSYNNITVTVEGESLKITEELIDTSLDFNAKSGDTIIIKINKKDITGGYEFKGYNYSFTIPESEGGESENGYELTFKMDSVHEGQTITINFSEIEYKVMIMASQGGSASISEPSDGQIVTLTNTYTITAIANEGFFVTNAYIEANPEDVVLRDLISNNDSTNLTTSFELNSSNFKSLIIDNAGEDNKVVLHVEFGRHTYIIKAYYSFDTNVYQFPSIKTTIEGGNEAIYAPAQATENNEVVWRAVTESINSGSNITLEILGDTIYEGMAFDGLYYKDGGEKLTANLTYTIDNILSNLEYKIKLKHIEYTPEFKIGYKNESGEFVQDDCGTANTISTSATLGNGYNFNCQAYNGFIFTEAWYETRESTYSIINSTSITAFNPKDFKINDNKFTIYVIFEYKKVELKISNVLPEGVDKGGYKDTDVANLCGTQVKRMRRTDEVDLTGEQIVVQKEDVLTFTVTPDSIGVVLTSLTIGTGPYTYSSLSGEEIFKTEEVRNTGSDQLESIYYVITVKFEADMIDSLYSYMQSQGKQQVEVSNNLSIRKYDITYNYNYSDFKFGIYLKAITDDGDRLSDKDASLNFTVAYGTKLKFTCSLAGDGVLSDLFAIKGFNFENRETTDSELEFDSTKWDELALGMYDSNDTHINVNLVLTPTITLRNYTTQSSDGYLYERTYNAKGQGLNDGDVVIGGDFDVIIQYLYEDGSCRTDKPINVGDYSVKIQAILTGDGIESRTIDYDEEVIVSILPVEVTLSFKKYNSTNPITKVYDGFNTFSSILKNKIIEDITFTNICSDEDGDMDVIKINVDGVSIRLSNSDVNENSALYNLIIENISLIDGVGQSVTNYKIKDGVTYIEFPNIGKITPKQIIIQQIEGIQFADLKKVNDGSTEVQINTERLIFNGVLQNDGVEIIKENLKFYHDPVDKNFKGKKQLYLDYSEALLGADSVNYVIVLESDINQNIKNEVTIHPYELEFLLDGVGTFKIVDLDKKCLIPLDCKLKVKSYAKGSPEYNKILNLTESRILKRENMQAAYEIIVQTSGGINLLVADGLYIYLPAVEKVTKVFQSIDETTAEGVEYSIKDGFIVIEAKRGWGIFGVVVKTTYMPLWLIILIVASAIAGVALIVLIFVLIRRRSKRKYQRFDKI